MNITDLIFTATALMTGGYIIFINDRLKTMQRTLESFRNGDRP